MEKRKRDVDAHECHSHTTQRMCTRVPPRACECEKEKRVRETAREGRKEHARLRGSDYWLS